MGKVSRGLPRGYGGQVSWRNGVPIVLVVCNMERFDTLSVSVSSVENIIISYNIVV
jgi:hypothetical protein